MCLDLKFAQKSLRIKTRFVWRVRIERNVNEFIMNRRATGLRSEFRIRKKSEAQIEMISEMFCHLLAGFVRLFRV